MIGGTQKGVDRSPVEWVVPLPDRERLRPVTQVRGTLFATSREQIRASGRFAEYESYLPAEGRAALDALVATTWLPVDVAHQHFAAVDRLGFSDAEVMAMTEAVSRKLNGVFMQTVSKMMSTSGVTPWDVAFMFDRAWKRIFVGGALGIAKLGPKDARMIVAAHPLVRYRYHRIGIARHLVTGVQFVVAKRVYVRELTSGPFGDRAEFLLQWG